MSHAIFSTEIFFHSLQVCSSQALMAERSLGPWKFALDMGYHAILKSIYSLSSGI